MNMTQNIANITTALDNEKPVTKPHLTLSEGKWVDKKSTLTSRTMQEYIEEVEARKSKLENGHHILHIYVTDKEVFDFDVYRDKDKQWILHIYYTDGIVTDDILDKIYKALDDSWDFKDVCTIKIHTAPQEAIVKTSWSKPLVVERDIDGRLFELYKACEESLHTTKH